MREGTPQDVQCALGAWGGLGCNGSSGGRGRACRLVVIVEPHVEGLAVLGVVIDNDRLLEVDLREVPVSMGMSRYEDE